MMQIRFTNKVHREKELLEKFLYYAIFIPPHTAKPPLKIIHKPELERYIDDWGQLDDHAEFAILNERVVGVCWSRCFPEDSPGYGTLTSAIPELSIAVLPAYRSKGIGSQLLTRFLDKIKFIYPAISLSVSRKNPAVTLYKRYSFIIVNMTPDTLIMLRNFTQ